MSNSAESRLITETEMHNSGLDYVKASYTPPNLYMSSASLELERNQKNRSAGNRIFQFCEKERLLAQKDLRIQELLMEGRSFKDQAGHIISELQYELDRTNQYKIVIEREISFLQKQNTSYKTLLEEKDAYINTLHTELSSSINVHIQEREIKSTEKESSSADKKVMEEQAITKLIGQLLKEFEFNKEGMSPDYALADIIYEVRRMKIEIKQLNEMKEEQANSLEELKRINEQHIWQKKQTDEINNQLSLSINHLKSQLEKYEGVAQQLKDQLDKAIKDKEEKQVQLFNTKLKIEGSKNNLTIELQKISQSSKGPLQEQQCKENRSRKHSLNGSKHSSSGKSKIKIAGLEKSLEKREKHIEFLQSILLKQKERAKRVLEMATEFGCWFNQLGESKFGSSSSMVWSKFKKSEVSEQIISEIIQETESIIEESIDE